MASVLDSSAVLAVLFEEPGAHVVAATIGDAVVSSVNFAEIIRVAMRKGSDANGARVSFSQLNLPVWPFGYAEAGEAAGIWELAPHLSLGDCACIALARSQSAEEVLTADRAWAGIDFGVPVRLIR